MDMKQVSDTDTSLIMFEFSYIYQSIDEEEPKIPKKKQKINNDAK